MKQVGNLSENCMEISLETFAQACEFLAKSASLFIYPLLGVCIIRVVAAYRKR